MSLRPVCLATGFADTPRSPAGIQIAWSPFASPLDGTWYLQRPDRRNADENGPFIFAPDRETRVEALFDATTGLMIPSGHLTDAELSGPADM